MGMEICDPCAGGAAEEAALFLPASASARIARAASVRLIARTMGEADRDDGMWRNVDCGGPELGGVRYRQRQTGRAADLLDLSMAAIYVQCQLFSTKSSAQG